MIHERSWRNAVPGKEGNIATFCRLHTSCGDFDEQNLQNDGSRFYGDCSRGEHLHLFHPLGATVTAFYVIPILVSLMADRRPFTMGLALVCTLLVILGYFLSIGIGIPRWIVIFDRSCVVLVIWITAILGIETTRAKKRIRELGQLLTLCAWTKQVKIEDKWIPIEEYLTKHCGLKISHGITKEAQKLYFRDMDIDIR
jgi:hypothetical protein